MARLKRDSKGRFLRRGKKSRRKATTVRRSRRSAAKKAWATRLRKGKKLKTTGIRRHAKYLRRKNPFSAIGRRGSFKLIPGMSEIKNAAIGGAGAVGSEVVRASVYSLMGRDLRNTSILEDAAGRIVAGGITGMLVGYIAGGAVASKVTEGAYTVAMYELVADAVAMASGGRERVLGVISNPFANRMVKPLLPSFGGQAALPAGPVGEDYTISGIEPEGAILPLGAVMPEGTIVPLGETGRFNTRF
jgi:hypothetical protein